MGMIDYHPRRKRAVQDTSKEAYADTAAERETLADRIVAHIIKEGGIFTRHEIARDLGIATATVSGRVNELIKAGRLAEEPGRFFCEVTGRQVRGITYVG